MGLIHVEFSETDVGYIDITFSCRCEWSGRRPAGGGTVVKSGRPVSAIRQIHRYRHRTDSSYSAAAAGAVDAVEIVVR